MKKLFFKLFRKQIEKRAQEISVDRMKGRVCAHDEAVKKAPIDCRVVLISDEPGSPITDALGISEKARERIEDALEDHCKDGVSFIAALEHVSAHCKHPNEVAWASMEIQKMINKQTNMAMGMLGGGGMGSDVVGKLFQAWLEHKRKNGEH